MNLHSPRKSPASREVISTHLHDCPECGESYAGYAPRCEDPKVLLCGKCLAEASFIHNEFAVMQSEGSVL